MKLTDVFKKYPENDPSFNGSNYMTIVDIGGDMCYSITHYNKYAEFEPERGVVVAFVEVQPIKILNAIK